MCRRAGTTGIVGRGRASMPTQAQVTAYNFQTQTDSAHEPRWGLLTRFALINELINEFLKCHCVY